MLSFYLKGGACFMRTGLEGPFFLVIFAVGSGYWAGVVTSNPAHGALAFFGVFALYAIIRIFIRAMFLW